MKTTTITREDLDQWFNFRPSDPAEIVKFDALRAAARAFADEVVRQCPTGPDSALAVRRIREAMRDAFTSVKNEGF